MTTATGTHIQLAGQGQIGDGYTFLAFSSGTGSKQRLWWHCGACWLTAPRKVKTMEAVTEQYRQHQFHCLGKPTALAYLHIGITPGAVAA